MSTRSQPGVTVDETELGEKLTQRLIWEVVGTHGYIKVKRKDESVEVLGPGDVDVADKIPTDAVSTRERFWEKVKIREIKDCWEWQACVDWFEYGRFWLSELEQSERAHRVSYRMTKGPIPDILQVNHLCDNPPCVNPFHLYLGTQSSNMKDSYERGRREQQDGTDMPHGFNADEVREIRRAYDEDGKSYRDLAIEYDVTQKVIGRIIRRETYRNVD